MGTILLIAVTVALAAVVATLVGGLGGGAVPPSATLNVTAKENSSGSTLVKLTIEHTGGNPLTLSDIKIIANTNIGTIENTLINANFSEITETTLDVGHSIVLTYDYGAACQGNSIRVQLIHVPSNQKIYDRSGISVGSA